MLPSLSIAIEVKLPTFRLEVLSTTSTSQLDCANTRTVARQKVSVARLVSLSSPCQNRTALAHRGVLQQLVSCLGRFIAGSCPLEVCLEPACTAPADKRQTNVAERVADPSTSESNTSGGRRDRATASLLGVPDDKRSELDN